MQEKLMCKLILRAHESVVLLEIDIYNWPSNWSIRFQAWYDNMSDYRVHMTPQYAASSNETYQPPWASYLRTKTYM